MRNVYSSFIVHSFDITTDIVVIVQWWFEHDIDGDDIDPRLMAQLSIIILLFHKIISTASIYVIDGNMNRALLQFCELLLLQEIYLAHRKMIKDKCDGSQCDHKSMFFLFFLHNIISIYHVT